MIFRVTDREGVEHDVVIDGEVEPDRHELVAMGEQLCVIVHHGDARKVYPVNPQTVR